MLMITMQSKPKIIKLLALIELLTGTIFMLLAVMMYSWGDRITAEESGISMTFVFMILGLISFISSPILYFIARRMEEGTNNT
jgi:prepilin signal peptidase PulO-like enzyme (type II secretory pathway)